MLKNIVFDLGGVIMTIDQQEALRRFEALGLKNTERQLDSYTQSGIFGAVEEGKITAEQFRQELSNMVGRTLTLDDCQYAWLGYRKEVPQRNLEFIKLLRQKGYHLILLSNTNPFMMDWALNNDFDGHGNSLCSYFDSLYLSYRIGVMKPSQTFFEKMIQQERINPQETLFVDDGPKNIEAGQLLGFTTVCPVNGSDWRAEVLAQLNIDK